MRRLEYAPQVCSFIKTNIVSSAHFLSFSFTWGLFSLKALASWPSSSHLLHLPSTCHYSTAITACPTSCNYKLLPNSYQHLSLSLQLSSVCNCCLGTSPSASVLIYKATQFCSCQSADTNCS